MRVRFTVPAVALGVAVASGVLHADAPRRLTLAQAVDAAGKDNPELAIAKVNVDTAEKRVDSAKALRLPKLSIDAMGLYYKDEITFIMEVRGMMVPVTARPQWTATFNAIVAQPISGLFVISKLIGLEEAGVDAAEHDLARARLDVTTQTAELYLRAMQASAYVAIAEQTITQLDTQKKRAEALQATGVLGKVDLMRIDSARSQAKSRLLVARDGRAQAIDAIVLFLGLHPGTTLETVDDLPAELPAVAYSDDQALALAAEKRPEVKAALARARQADGGVDVKRSDYAPNVNAFAQYSHTENAGFIAQEDDMFVGVSLKWDLWDWGRRKADVAEARGKARMAHMAAERQKDTIAVDVRNKIRTARTTKEAIDVAKEGLATAEEAYRIISLRYQSGDATTLDLLDVETEVAQARLLAATARYDYAIALVHLARALGLPPLAALNSSTPASR